MTVTLGRLWLLLWASALLVERAVSQNAAPHPSIWHKEKNKFMDWLLESCVDGDTATGSECGAQEHHSEYESYDGFYNNFARPEQGAVDTPLLRLLPPAYRDGVYEPAYREVNPLTVSENTMNGSSGQLSNGGKTALLVFFGQQVVEEILDAQRPGCPPEYFNIPVPEGHPYSTEHPRLDVLPLLRTRYDANTGYSPGNPRQQ
ncbi:hypothetical protein FHG87_024895, partial [Trinorchestia longiramus]